MIADPECLKDRYQSAKRNGRFSALFYQRMTERFLNMRMNPAKINKNNVAMPRLMNALRFLLMMRLSNEQTAAPMKPTIYTLSASSNLLVVKRIHRKETNPIVLNIVANTAKMCALR